MEKESENHLNFKKISVKGFYIECENVKNKEFSKLFDTYQTLKLDPSMSREEKKKMLTSCLSDSKERIDPAQYIIQTLVEQNENDHYPIILSRE